ECLLLTQSGHWHLFKCLSRRDTIAPFCASGAAMRRREFIALVGGAAATCPLAVRGQQGDRIRRIAVLMAYAESDSEAQAWVAAFRESLQKLGWMEGRDIEINVRWATRDRETIERFAKELVVSRPELFLASSTPPTAALLQQTRSIPIVFALVSDPVGSGFVASFPRPGGNVTGFTTMEPTMAGKWLELLKEITPASPTSIPIQPGKCALCRILPQPLQSRYAVLRSGGDHRACSRHVRARIRLCRRGARTKW